MKLNPVFRKELKLTTRTWKIAGTLSIYTAVLSLVSLFIFYQMLRGLAESGDYSGFTVLYAMIAGIQFVLILFTAPPLTASAISGERERQTLDLLLSTKLKPRSIIIGKLLSSISMVILLVLASIPIFALVFMFGIVTIPQLLGLIAYYVFTALFVGSIGIFVSTYFKKTTVSNVVTYAVGLFLVLGTIFISYVYYTFLFQNNPKAVLNNNLPFFPLLYANPLIGFFTIITNQIGLTDGFLPAAGLRVIGYSENIWIINVIVESIIAILLLFASSVRLNPIKKMSKRRVK